MGWVPCRGDRYYSRPGVATDIASEIHGHSVSFLASASDSDRWSTRRALQTRYRANSLHNIHPTPLEPIESKWFRFWGPCRFQALYVKRYKLDLAYRVHRA
ncbi:hypothetical protein TNCV_3101341 [Trichonephila clavipes]|nr:hypothetical protein TNCV_3101341 [Trichonephila clavipes]